MKYLIFNHFNAKHCFIWGFCAYLVKTIYKSKRLERFCPNLKVVMNYLLGKFQPVLFPYSSITMLFNLPTETCAPNIANA